MKLWMAESYGTLDTRGKKSDEELTLPKQTPGLEIIPDDAWKDKASLILSSTWTGHILVRILGPEPNQFEIIGYIFDDSDKRESEAVAAVFRAFADAEGGEDDDL